MTTDPFPMTVQSNHQIVPHVYVVSAATVGLGQGPWPRQLLCTEALTGQTTCLTLCSQTIDGRRHCYATPPQVTPAVILTLTAPIRTAEGATHA